MAFLSAGSDAPERLHFHTKKERELFVSAAWAAKNAPKFEDITILILTWNVGNAPPPDTVRISVEAISYESNR